MMTHALVARYLLMIGMNAKTQRFAQSVIANLR